MDLFLQRLFDGLSQGSIYALIALGLVIIYRASGHLNFAQGEMGLFAAYVVYQMGEWGFPIAIALVIGMAAGFGIAAGAEVGLMRPLGKKSPFAVFIATIALFLGINWLDRAIWGDQVLPNSGVGSKQTQFPSLFPDAPTDFVKIFGAAIRYEAIGVILLVLLVTALLFLVFNKTKFGLAMRAVASNPDSARLVGIRTPTVLMMSWGVAGALAAVGAVAFAGINNNVNPGLMFTVFIYASAAATLGGFDSPGGAVIGGFTIGVVENMAAGYFPNWIGQEMKLAVAFAIIVGVLLVKPSGLFGTPRVERV
jgi:branched-chain amino acid transport system permease protein